MGCEHDVTQKLHTICSGRQTCQFEVSDIGKEREPCKKDFTSYLDAEFKCQDCKYYCSVNEHFFCNFLYI